jgi:hypothetical protein
MRLTLAEKFTEVYILKLSTTKPTRVVDLEIAKEILSDIRMLRGYAIDASDNRLQAPDSLCKVKLKKGWGKHFNRSIYVTTASRIVRLDLLIEALEERVVQLEADKRQKAAALQLSRQASKQLARKGYDNKLASALWHALDTTPPTVGFVYLKRWSMPDGNCWYKVGITINPDRREIEQNVLPVAAETIACVDVGSMDRARAIEAVIHQVLEEQRITDANNRELFHLSAQQAFAVKAVLEKLE